MVTAQANRCPRCGWLLTALNLYEPTCLRCGYAQYSDTPLDTFMERLAQAKIRTEVAEHHNAMKVVCPDGHPYSEANTYMDRKGSRRCRTCIQPTRTRARRIAGLGAL